jgi:hypothetical protein
MSSGVTDVTPTDSESYCSDAEAAKGMDRIHRGRIIDLANCFVSCSIVRVISVSSFIESDRCIIFGCCDDDRDGGDTFRDGENGGFHAAAEC